MTGLAIYAMGSPFKRLPRVEYVYGAASGEGLDPVAPLLDDNMFDNHAIVFVADIYSVWPEVGAFPRAVSYREVRDTLREFMERRCGIRLSPRLCRRLDYHVVPWRGVMGAWRFTGGPGDALAYMFLAVAETVSSSGRLSTIYVVTGEDEPAGLARLAETAGLLASALTGAPLVIVSSEPRPYPPEHKRPLVELVEAEQLEPWQATGLLVYRAAIGAKARRLLESRTPKGIAARRFSSEEIELTLASLAFARRGYLLPLAYQACGAGDPIGKLAAILSRAVELYEESTQLSKKPIGGTLVHHVGFNTAAVLALAAGAAVEAAVLRSIGRQACEELYSNGLSTDALEKIRSAYGYPGPDATPRKCITESNGRLRLAEGCLKKLRQTVLA